MKEERLNYYKEWIEENEEIVVDSSIFKELVDEINRLNNIINKAIELLNDWNYLDKIDCYYEPKEVIDILKGDNK